MSVPSEIVDLVNRFREHYESYRSPSYNETQVRREFVEQKRLDPSKDTIDIIPGSIGSYPNCFLVVDAQDVPDLIDMLENFDGSEEYVAKLDKCGVNRAEERFWDAYDWFQRRLNEADPLHAGLYDLNRYYSRAVSDSD